MFADAEAGLFSLKTFASLIASYYISLRIGFSQPVWALSTVVFVSQPMAGQVLSKALYRLMGTVLGGAATVAFLPAFVNEPIALSFVLALWLGFCLYIALLDRTPRSYVFLLAGYTASIIGFPSVMTPGSIFNTAVLRVQEIGIGIVTTSLVHAAILPRTLTVFLRQQIAATVSSVEQVSRRALSGRRETALGDDRRRLASGVINIEQLTYHLVFDTERLLPRGAAIRALQDRVFWLLPLSGSVEDCIAECGVTDGGLPAEVVVLIRRVESWLSGSIAGPGRDEFARELLAEAKDLEGSLFGSAAWDWRDTLLVTLLARLAELVVAHRILREIQDHILSGRLRDLSPEAARFVQSARARSLHRDHALALRSALGAVAALCAICGFWIATAWPSGPIAALIAGVSVSLFASLPYPGVGIRRFLKGFLFSIPAAAIYGFVLFPRVTDFAMLAAVIAPLLLLFGSLLARPPLAPISLGVLVGFINTVGFASTYQSSFDSFVNTAIAEAAGTCASVTFIDIFQVIGAELAFSRLFRAAFRDIANRADGQTRDTGRWASRMFDRIALIAVRSGPTGMHPALPPYDALVGLRIGYLLGELHAFCSTLADGEEGKAIQAALAGLSLHYRAIGAEKRTPVSPAVLHSIDRAMAGLVTDPRADRRRQGVVLLTGLRRSLFPGAPALAGELS
jgi:uncharacterized membrane protein YccC